MPLSAGDRLGPYEIASVIGRGGMGEVWKARDPRLNRDVAIKTSHIGFSGRFQIEAQSVAALNHPNICTLYDVGADHLVMEYIEGETLADRIQRGPIPLDEALAIAKQIADALEAAHDRGIVHRDLKPANIKIRPDGSVKVLDFGLAKAVQTQEVTADSPTLLLGATTAGAILGTAGYMSPEQARGQAVDKRADIWAFGVVLYEMLTAKPLFNAPTLPDSLVGILSKEPDLSLAPEKTRRLLRRCLEKDPKKRLRDITGAALLLEDNLEDKREAPSRSRTPWMWIAATSLLAIVAGAFGLIGFTHFREKESGQILRFTIPPEKGTFINAGPPAVSPDGHRVAYVVRVEGKSQLWVRDLDTLHARPLDTEDARFPFWSPDSRTVGFFSNGKLKKVDAAGGPALTLCDAVFGAGGTWNRDGVILFSPSGLNPISRVSAAGGSPVPITSLDKSLGEVAHRFPSFLPDGRHFLYTAAASEVEKAAIYIGDLDTPQRHRLISANSNAVYAQPGYVLYMRLRTLMAQPIDAGKFRTTGDAVPVAEQLDASAGSTSVGLFSTSANGVLAYTSDAVNTNAQLTWFDRSGKPAGTVSGPGTVEWPAISPDGKTIAFDRIDPQTGYYDIWVHDIGRGAESRFTFNSRNNQCPVWAPDGNYIAFDSDRSGHENVYRKATSGAGEDQALDKDDLTKRPTDWSADGHSLFEETNSGSQKTAGDIWVSPITADQAAAKAYPYLQTQFSEGQARLAPNGQWLAYRSNETQRNEVYVMTFPNPGGKWQISSTGGNNPVWSRDGKELFFTSADSKLMAVSIQGNGGKLETGAPQALFPVRMPVGNGRFDVAKDGRFLIPAQVEQNTVAPMTVVVNWPAGLTK